MDVSMFKGWLESYGLAWESRDAAAATRIFTEQGTYQETPFDEPMRGHAAIRAYWEAVPRSQDRIEFESKVLSFDGCEGIAHWKTSFIRVPSGVRVELDGIFLVRFAEDGRCVEFREWWHRREGSSPGE